MANVRSCVIVLIIDTTSQHDKHISPVHTRAPNNHVLPTDISMHEANIYIVARSTKNLCSANYVIVNR